MPGLEGGGRGDGRRALFGLAPDVGMGGGRGDGRRALAGLEQELEEFMLGAFEGQA